MTRYDDHARPAPLCRDPQGGLIFGVCAGIARYFDWPLWLTRVLVFLSAWIFTIATLVGYILAALLLPEPEPSRSHGRRGNDPYTRHYRS